MEIWIGRNGERHGPYKEDDVREWLRSGQISREDLGWYEGLADWQPLSVLFADVVIEPPAVASASPTVAALPQITTASLEDYAGFWKRVAAYVLDNIILFIPNMLVQKMMGGDAAEATLRQAQLAAPNDPNVVLAAFVQYYHTMAPAMLIITVIAWLYFALCESSTWQATVGKLAVGIRVTDTNGKRIGFVRALGRYPAKYLSALILCVGFLMVAWTRRKQGLHDLIVDTLVLNGRASDFASAPVVANDGNTFSA